MKIGVSPTRFPDPWNCWQTVAMKTGSKCSDFLGSLGVQTGDFLPGS